MTAVPTVAFDASDHRVEDDQPITTHNLLLGHLRAVWWRLRRHEGFELPPQDDVILIRGDKR